MGPGGPGLAITKTRVPHLLDSLIVANRGPASFAGGVSFGGHSREGAGCRVPHISILRCGHRAKHDRTPYRTSRRDKTTGVTEEKAGDNSVMFLSEQQL